ncbi:MAG: RNA polymerase sigma factor [Planctomycetia bacterium]|nr:RNA polymerase sigma factor [Planctomycetia bacterium]
MRHGAAAIYSRETTRVDLTDVQIMQAVQAGQVELFDLLVCRYRGPLLNVAWSKLGDRNWAEDVVQETFLAAFAARDTYNPAFAFRTWVWTILLNLCRRQWKRRESRPGEQSLAAPAQRGDGPAVEPATYDTPLSQALLIERRAQVHVLLNSLPEVQADALRLRFFGGLQFSEIALAMDSSVSAAKQRVKSGLITLAEQLRQTGGELS